MFLYSSMKERPCLQFALMHWWLPWGTIHNSCGLLLPMLGCPVCDQAECRWGIISRPLVALLVCSSVLQRSSVHEHFALSSNSTDTNSSPDAKIAVPGLGYPQQCVVDHIVRNSVHFECFHHTATTSPEWQLHNSSLEQLHQSGK